LNKVVVPTILVATVIIGGIFAFIPVNQATTVHTQIIDAINAGNTALALELLEDLGGGHDDLGVGHFNITAELQDKIKLLNATDDEVINFSNFVNATITVEALNAANQTVIFNLKEVYLCGIVGGEPGISNYVTVNSIWIQNVNFTENGVPDEADIEIFDIYGGPLGVELIGGDTCVEVLSSLATPGIGMAVEIVEVYPGRAGAMGLGSDNNLVILLDLPSSGQLYFVKCIAFTPNEAVELVCDLDGVEEIANGPT